MLLSFRADISRSGEEGWTPLHEACRYDRIEIAFFLIEEERKRVCTAQVQEQDGLPGRDQRRGQHDTPSYNMTDKVGLSPVFSTESVNIVEAMLELHDLQVTKGDGEPLLWHCASTQCISERVASDLRLVRQYGQRWQGRLPLEEGEQRLETRLLPKYI